MGSLFFYTALALSDAREGEAEEPINMGPTKYFSLVALPMIMLGYISLIIGLVFFFISLGLLQIFQSPSWLVVGDFNWYMMWILTPLCVFLSVLSVIALTTSNHSKGMENVVENIINMTTTTTNFRASLFLK